MRKKLSEFQELRLELEKTSKLIEPLLFDYLFSEVSFIESLYEKISSSFLEIGERIRPFLMRLAYEIRNDKFLNILPIAAAVELMNISTIIIDDILDHSHLRNARPSMYRRYGVENSILFSEVLKSIASSIIINYFQDERNNRNKEKVIKLFEETYREICIGQYLDLLYEQKDDITEYKYLKMIGKTTASFIKSSLEIGALLSNTSEEIIKKLRLYGVHLGYAYQIRDDIIDIIGEEEFTGKPFALDIKCHKKRLPIIHAFLNGSKSQKAKLKQLYNKEYIDDSSLSTIIHLLYETGSIHYSINLTKKFSDKAIKNLNGLQNSNSKKYLIQIAELVACFNC